MSQEFDPYRKWLGIPPGERPPDHYRLLGIGQFEDDPDTICNAADRQMAHLRTFQTGAHSALSQKLLNEIAAARLTLLDSAKKAEYDKQLQASAGSQAPPPAAVDVPSPTVPALPVARLATPLQPPTAQPVSAAPLQALIEAPSQELIDLRETAARKKTPRAAWLVGALLLLLLGGSGAFYLIVRGGDRPREKVEKSAPLVDAIHDKAPAAGAPVAEATDAAPVPDSDLQAAEDAAETRKPTPRAPKLEIMEARWGAGDRWQDITERMRSLVSNEQLLASASGSLFEGVPDPAYGTVKQVQIRYRAAGEPGEAEIPNGELIYLDGRPAAARKPSSEGLQVLAARYGAGATWIDVLPRVRRWVHGDRLSVRVRFTAPIDPLPNQGKALFLRYRTADGEFFTHAWDGQELILDAQPIATAGKPQDLIGAADPARDSAGGWQKEDGVLIGPDASTDNLAIPMGLVDEYLLTAVFAGSPRPVDVGLTLPIGDRQVQLALAGWTGAVNALQLVDGASGERNATTRSGRMFERGESTIVRCAVGKSGIKVTCNGRVAVDWRGDRSKLSAPPETQAPEPPAVVLRSQSNPWRIVRLEVSPLAAEPAPPAPSDEVVDLLERIDPELDAVSGQWQKSDEGLLSPHGDATQGAARYSRLGVPYSPPDDYRLRVVVAPKSANEAFYIGLVVGGRQTNFVIDGWGSTLTGLHGLDGKTADRNATRRLGRVFLDERPKEFVCIVHPSSIRITCEDKLLVDWHGDNRRFSLGCQTPDALGLFLGSWKTQFLVSKFELRALPPESPEPPTNLSQPVDVLAQVDPQRDAVRGEWRKPEGALLAPARQWARLQLPVLPPEEYTLRVDEVGGRDVTLGVVVSGRQVAVTLDGWSGELSGMSNVDGRSGDRNATTHHGNVLRDDSPNAIVCTVRRDRVEVACNGKRVIDWQGDPSALSLLHDWVNSDDRRLFVGSWSAPFRITRIELSTPGAARGAVAKAGPAGEKRRSLGDLLDAPAPDPRLDVPTAAALAAADKKVAEKFEPQWKAAKQLSDRVAVARKLYEAGLATADDPVLRYALLREACRQAASLGDAGIACDAIDQLGREYKIDALADKLAAAGDALVKAHSAAQNWTLALVALLLCDQAMNNERYEEARKFASLSAAAGRRTRNHDLKTYSERRLADVRNRQEQQKQFEKAMVRLQDDPDDAASNLAAGIDLCLLQGDWRHGLPRLARSDDRLLGEIAKLEAEAGGDPARRAALVDAWMAEAQQQAGELRTECQLQAKYWFDRGLPEAALTPDRLRVKAMLEKQFGPSAISRARLAPGLDMAMFAGADFQQFRARRVDGQISHHYGFGSPDPKVPGDYFSIRWTGWLKPPLPGKYLIKTFSDDSIRVRINGKRVIDHWARGAGGEQVEVELTDQFQPISVEYNDYEVSADVELSWALKGLSDFHAIPAEALFHDPAIEP